MQEISKIFIGDLTHYILPYLLVVALLTAIGLPFSNLFFGKSEDKGLSVSFFVSMFVIGAITFTLGSFFPIKTLNPICVFGVTSAWVLLNLLLYRSDFKNIIKNWLKENYRTLIFQTILFTLLFFAMYFLLARRPEIYQIERFMDFGFIRTLESTKELPLQDVWFAGKTTNYYYFSHMISYILNTLSGQNSMRGFYLMSALLFAATGTIIFSLSKEITKIITHSNLYSVIAGLLSTFLFCFSGPLQSIKWFLNSVTKGKWFPNDYQFWYAEATRSIKGTITEIPFFSYLEANIHPHVFGYLMTVVILYTLWSFYTYGSDETNKPGPLRYKFYLFISFLLGISFITNTWDILPLILVTGTVFAIEYKKSLLNFGIREIYSALIFLLVTAPLVLFLKTPVKGLDFVHQRSNFQSWLFFWGIFLIAVLLCLKYFIDLTKSRVKIFLALILGYAIFLFIFSETFYFKDILSQGEWFRANTFLKLTGHEWISLSLFTGVMISYSIKRNKFFLLLLITVLSVGSIYPIKTTQYFIQSKQYMGISNPLLWLANKYPYDYDALMFLDKQPKPFRIVEASGESYEDNNYYSVYLGAPSIVGWPVHEWTWRGDYTEVGNRRTEVSEIYTGEDIERSKILLKKYKIDYIILGEQESRIYGGRIQTNKLLSLGEPIYGNTGVTILKVY